MSQEKPIVDDEYQSDLEEIRRTEAYPVLKEKLTDEQIVFVWRAFQASKLCGLCWNYGPYCCYDSVRED